jgi:uncharacterized protein (TIGR03435 family)
MKSERYDINATMPPDTRWEQLQSMARTMLAERFHLKVHHETKEMSVYALVIGRNGSKLREVEPGRGSFNMGRGQIRAQKAPLFAFAERLSQYVDRPVLDLTGLKRTYDFTLEWTPDASADAREENVAAAGPSIFTALQEQLGLRLEARKAGIEVLVVDGADRIPTGN